MLTVDRRQEWSQVVLFLHWALLRAKKEDLSCIYGEWSPIRHSTCPAWLGKVDVSTNSVPVLEEDLIDNDSVCVFQWQFYDISYLVKTLPSTWTLL